MSRDFLNTPFEHLEDFTDIRKLVIHILQSIHVKEITAHVPSGVKKTLFKDPNYKLKIRYIVVGNASFNYILHRSEYLLSHLNDRIDKLNKNRDLSFDDKLKEYQDIRKSIWHEYQYFDSMNPIRYMSQYRWKISYMKIVKGQPTTHEENIANSLLDLNKGHWNEIENTFLIRRHLLYEILYLIDEEIQKIQTQLTDTRYSWDGKERYEIYELVVALLASNRVKIERGDENTFVHESLSLFGVSDDGYVVARNKILNRKQRSSFLTQMEDAFEKYNKPSYRK